MDDQQYYWHLILKDDYGKAGEIVRVKPVPERVQQIQAMIAKGEGAITTPTRSLPIKEIKEFRLSDERYTDQKLLEGSSQAFGEPIYVPGAKISRPNPDGTPGEYQYNDAIAAKWVKKSVPRRRWDTYYSKFGSYKKLEDNDSYVTMAFVLPVHSIDYKDVQDVTGEEFMRLDRTPS